jgi:hypothetical protein
MLKPNYIGIIAGILAFISIALPWWTLTISAGGEISLSSDISVYLYQVTSAGLSITLNTWYTWAALALVIVGGILSIVGSVTAIGKKLLLGGGVLALLSIIIFAVGLQMDITSTSLGEAGVGLFSSGSYMGASYSSYLSYGFWIALVAAIIAFVAFAKHPTEAAAAPPS